MAKSVSNFFKTNKVLFALLFTTALPIIIQNAITNFSGLLDNIMVGRLGELQTNGVSSANQLFFVLQLCLYGAVGGAGIYTAQFFGTNNHSGIKFTLIYKIVIAVIVALVGMAIFYFFGENLISLFVKGEGAEADKQAVINYGKSYILIILIGIIPFGLSQAYASTLRETLDTVFPMIASAIAVLVNLILNYTLIFGKFGAPELGVNGAAIATVISRYIEAALLIFRLHFNSKYEFVKREVEPKVSKQVFLGIVKTSLTLFVNELLWSGGITTINQCYSTCGLTAYAAVNIVSTLSNTLNVVNISLGTSIGILLGQMLGQNKQEEAKKASRAMTILSVMICAAISIVSIAISPFFPKLYAVSDEIRNLATSLIIIAGCIIPVDAIANASYNTLRSGGKVFLTFMFDSGFTWLISVPLAFCLSRFTQISIIPLFFAGNAINILKSAIGLYLTGKGIWLNNIVEK